MNKQDKDIMELSTQVRDLVLDFTKLDTDEVLEDFEKFNDQSTVAMNALFSVLENVCSAIVARGLNEGIPPKDLMMQVHMLLTQVSNDIVVNIPDNLLRAQEEYSEGGGNTTH